MVVGVRKREQSGRSSQGKPCALISACAGLQEGEGPGGLNKWWGTPQNGEFMRSCSGGLMRSVLIT